MQHPGGRAARAVASIGLIAAVLGVLVGAAPVAAGVPSGDDLEGSARLKLVGLPGTWTLTLDLQDNGGPTDAIGLTVTKRNAAKTAWAMDQLRLEGGLVHCTTKLATCTVDDQGDLGTYGRVKLAFAARKPRVTRDLTCFKSDVVYATRVSRAGVLTGTLRYATKSALMGTIRNGSGAHRVTSTMPITMRRTHDTGVACPVVPSACRDGAWLHANGYSVAGYRPLPTGKGSQGFVDEVKSAEPGVTRAWYVSISAPGNQALKLQTQTSLAAATLDLTPAAPFVTGTVGFTASAPLAPTTFLGCDVVSRTGSVAVDITWHMPGRPTVHDVSNLPGELIRRAS